MKSLGYLLLASSVVLTSSCSGATGPEISGMCAAAVKLEGSLYFSAKPTSEPPAGVDRSAPYARVSVYDPTCNDTVRPGEIPDWSMEDGESNFLPVGTPLYRIHGHPFSERLAAPRDDAWFLLAPPGADGN